MHTNLNEYLKVTDYCDHTHPLVKIKALEITKGIEGTSNKAVALFYWVRDNILYRVGLWNEKASKTLESREGTCTNSANLLVAFCRSLKIPAGFGVMSVRGRSYFGPVALPMMRKYIAEISTHIYASIYLDSWLKIDPSDDYEFCLNTGYFNPTGTLLEWDGTHHAEITFHPKDIISDSYPVPTIQKWMTKTPKNGKGIKMHIANEYIRFLRSNKIIIRSHGQLYPLFLSYLIKNKHVKLFLFYVCFYLYYKVPILLKTEKPVPVNS